MRNIDNGFNEQINTNMERRNMPRIIPERNDKSRKRRKYIFKPSAQIYGDYDEKFEAIWRIVHPHNWGDSVI